MLRNASAWAAKHAWIKVDGRCPTQGTTQIGSFQRGTWRMAVYAHRSGHWMQGLNSRGERVWYRRADQVKETEGRKAERVDSRQAVAA